MKGQIILLLLCAALASAKDIRPWNKISKELPTIANPPSGGLTVVDPPSGGPTVVNPPSGEPTVVDPPSGGPTVVDTRPDEEKESAIDDEEESSSGVHVVDNNSNEESSTPAGVEEDDEGYLAQIFPHENCNQFYLIAEGISEVLTCPANLLYNPDTKRCDWPNKVECGDRIVPESEKEEESAVDDEEESSSGVHVVDNTSSEESPANSGCRYNGQLLPSENCNQFTVCAHGVPVVMNCPGFLLYNPKNNICDWPKYVDCGDRVIPEVEESEPVSEETTDNGSSGLVVIDEVAGQPEEADEESAPHVNDNGVVVIS